MRGKRLHRCYVAIERIEKPTRRCRCRSTDAEAGESERRCLRPRARPESAGGSWASVQEEEA